MKFKKIATAMIFATTFVAGCSSDDSSTETSVTFHKPKADYNFNDLELVELLSERASLLVGTLTYNGNSYQAIYGQDAADKMLVMFENHIDKNDRISMLIPAQPTDTSYCELLGENSFTSFNCKITNVTSENEHMRTYQATSTSGSESFTLEVSEYLSHMGSTAFELIDNGGGQYVIKTLNPFSKYGYHETELALSSYVELSTILTRIGKGNDINLIFDSRISGSSDDDINMYTGLMIREYGLSTHISKSGSVFSGGTDLFSAGVKRTIELRDKQLSVEQNEQIGVHSWSDDNEQGEEVDATDIPYTDVAHRKQATYFTKMLGDDGLGFYMFTIKSAPADGEHYMTKDELNKYQLVNEIN
ncbi:hypothetical protein C942_04484 [Photobacterium marinum]|uniref:Alpha/beta hydrolase n=1 Tax=Photobacterium marinum TaxID=1056511 RepID=L8JD80_9GAMM|nr:hypothetical protein [Photobacterium marinum]ELR66786.1 hypothetical protein C942_04484 [Photobacterium marinum]